MVAFDQLGLGQGVAALDEVLDAVQESSSSGQWRRSSGCAPDRTASHCATPYPARAECVMQDGSMPPEPQERVIDRLAGLHIEHLGHQVDDGAVGVRLSGGVFRVVDDFLTDRMLVA